MIGIVVAHPDPSESDRIARALRARSLQVYTTADIKGILDTARQAKLCAILVDPGLLEREVVDLRIQVRKAMGYHAPVIALTHVATAVRTADLKRHGASLLSKPIEDLVALADLMAEVARRLELNPALQAKVSDVPSTRAADAPAAKTVTAGKGSDAVSVLVVDDEDTIRRFITEALKEEGYRVFAAANALDAVEFLRKNDVALVISDINMPGMDGFELKLKADEVRKRPVPFIFLTADASRANASNAEALGAVAFLSKPIRSLTVFYGLVQETLRQK